jgi:hypothetical protein
LLSKVVSNIEYEAKMQIFQLIESFSLNSTRSPLRAKTANFNSPCRLRLGIHRLRARPGMLTHGLYFRTAPQAALSLHKPLREPKVLP